MTALPSKTSLSGVGRAVAVVLPVVMALVACTPVPAQQAREQHGGQQGEAPAPGSAQPATQTTVQPPALPEFATWLDGVKSDARARGVSEKTLAAALNGVQPLKSVLVHDQAQPEFTLTFAQYLGHTVNPARVAEGRRLYALHRDVLDQVEKRYGVPGPVVVALWGIESDFGHATGGFQVIPALVTLAYGGRRAAFFRGELLAALQIADGAGIAPGKMSGSWAGAMGQSQFMPSTYLKYAAKWEGAGKPDIWTNVDDVFASAANYLSSIGWDKDTKWGRPVQAPDSLAMSQGPNGKKSVRDWAKLGVRAADGAKLPDSAVMAALLRPDQAAGNGNNGPAFLVYDNFQVILKWNHSNFFAISAGTLADQIANR